jgi:hypothetical protein
MKTGFSDLKIKKERFRQFFAKTLGELDQGRLWSSSTTRGMRHATVKLALSKYRNAIRAVDPDHLVLRPRKMRSGQRFSLALQFGQFDTRHGSK